jgi:HTH-type transcriptional regulator/antitoxin HigA
MLEMQMARFFKVANVNEVPHMAHAARKSNYEDILPAQLAWLYRVRQMAENMAAPKYSEKALNAAMSRLRALTLDPEEIRHVPRILSECGIRFVVVECLPNAKIDGVCFWLDPRSPVVGMSLRHDRIDNFWFVLRHELEHVLQEHGRDHEMIDLELEGERAGTVNVPEEEAIANGAAANFCIPQNEIASFIARKNPFFSERDVIGFARRLQVHPGIVIGQIQKQTGRWELLRKYLVKVRHFVIPGVMSDGWGQVAPVRM